MGALGRRDSRFFDITRLRQVGSRYFAMTGLRQTVLVGSYAAGAVNIVGETADLGAEALDVASDNTDLFILTDSGLQIATLADVPVVSETLAFDRGDGRWIAQSSGYIVAPIKGGIQVINPADMTTRISRGPGLGGCIDAVLDSEDILYVVDDVKAKIHVFRVFEDAAIYVDSFRAPNCRNVVKVALDEDNSVLFVVCKNRLVSFDVPNAGVEDDEISVTVKADYGHSVSEYTDLVVTPDGYWVGIDSDSAMNPTPGRFYGAQIGLFDLSQNDHGVLLVACPNAAFFATTDTIPVLAEDDLGDTTDPDEIIDPPVIVPKPPIITSDLAVEVDLGSNLVYQITATGEGPITYGVIDPPVWLTSINVFTGAISGTPPAEDVYSITITATNAGGTDTEVLVVTVESAIVMDLTYTIDLGTLQGMGSDTPFPEGTVDMFSVPAGRTVAHFYIETVTTLAIASDPSVDCAISAGTNAVAGIYTTVWSDIIPQRSQVVAVGGNTDYPAAAPNPGPYSPSQVKFRVGINGSIFARFNQLTAGEFFVHLTLDPP